jgi:glycosyltransferase involved in cell wall biosynthesis
MAPQVSVIVPVKDDDGALSVLLDSLAHQSFPLEEVEVLVVHNDEHELEVAPREGLTVRVLTEARPCSYAARNRGIEHAEGKVLAFTDADCVAHPDWLQHGVEAVRKRPDAVVAGEIQVFACQVEPNLAEKHQLAFAFDQDVNVAKRRGLPTANVFVSADVLGHVGGFNPQMRSGGDAEWSKRALRHGYHWRIQTDAVVYHPARSTFSQLRAQRARFATAIHAQPTGLRRLDWYLNWISPRQGLMGRLRQRYGLRKRDWPALVLAQLSLAVFQVGVGLAETLRPSTREGTRKIEAVDAQSWVSKGTR